MIFATKLQVSLWLKYCYKYGNLGIKSSTFVLQSLENILDLHLLWPLKNHIMSMENNRSHVVSKTFSMLGITSKHMNQNINKHINQLWYMKTSLHTSFNLQLVLLQQKFHVDHFKHTTVILAEKLNKFGVHQFKHKI